MKNDCKTSLGKRRHVMRTLVAGREFLDISRIQIVQVRMQIQDTKSGYKLYNCTWIFGLGAPEGPSPTYNTTFWASPNTTFGHLRSDFGIFLVPTMLHFSNLFIATSKGIPTQKGVGNVFLKFDRLRVCRVPCHVRPTLYKGPLGEFRVLGPKKTCRVLAGRSSFAFLGGALSSTASTGAEAGGLGRSSRPERRRFPRF